MSFIKWGVPTFARDKREVEVKEFSHEYSREYANKIGPGPPAYSKVDYGDDPDFKQAISSENVRSTSAYIGKASRKLLNNAREKIKLTGGADLNCQMD
eukprot:CAMPEP_0176341138 /NCGR_PEP_ID=MMETSP0126-20121128/2132_1 /TAXON_ID=141414 ORGANISM="Strombidinopsis acuminatum, Strain SPMC142" /NCGR_SAMPLE_ID=MMETSP0126 /ASSEMBLY_ACC=CAM_ASM_000229 /LENGTH=97 /DNA_ID=CAMNT_0017685763 /DNA_START=246 /DNA_END=539 /DNA_ORIENTATION=-